MVVAARAGTVAAFMTHCRRHKELSRDSQIWVLLLDRVRVHFKHMSDVELLLVFEELGMLLEDNTANLALLRPISEAIARTHQIEELASEALGRAPQLNARQLAVVLWSLAVSKRWRPQNAAASILVSGSVNGAQVTLLFNPSTCLVLHASFIVPRLVLNASCTVPRLRVY